MKYTDQEEINLIQAVRDKKITSSVEMPSIINGNNREEIFQKIKKLSVPESPALNGGRVLVVIGAGPISGKSTLRHVLLGQLNQNGLLAAVVVTSEILRYSIPEYKILRNIAKNNEAISSLDLSKEDIKNIEFASYDFVRSEANQFSSRLIEEVMQERRPVIIESHMDNPQHIQRMLETAKENDYETILLSPTVDIERIFERGEKRFQETGKRFVVGGVLQHQKDFELQWDNYTEMFDVAIRLDNNGKTPYPIAIAVNGELSILEEASYERARQKVEINPSAKTAEKALPEKRRYCKFERTQDYRMGEGNGKSEGRGFAGKLNAKGNIIKSIIRGINGFEDGSNHR